MLIATDSTVETFVVESPATRVRGVVQQVLWSLQSAHQNVERRRAQRIAYPYPLRIWPANACRLYNNGSVETFGEGSIVMGKHLSSGGLDFYTREPVADRKVVISLEGGDVPTIHVLAELTWCRFGGHGMYVNGGRFVRALDATQELSRRSG